VDAAALDAAVEAAQLTADSLVLEIGPGLGALTRALARRARRILAVEVDPRLCALLRVELLADLDNVTLLEADFLRLDLPAALSAHLGEPPYACVANLPYAISSPALERLLSLTPPLSRAVLMLQREVGDRLLAAPGSKTYGRLTLFAQLRAEVRRVREVSRGCFYPQPQVDSVLLEIVPRTRPLFPDLDVARFDRLVRAAFGQRRKTLLNSLTGGELDWNRSEATQVLQSAGLDPSSRAESLSLAEFARLERTACGIL